MKLKYISDYKSIRMDIKSCLDNLDFPDFSIITGTNGSGKTHLLEAIAGKHIKVSIEGIEDYGPIAHFNYQNFVLEQKQQQWLNKRPGMPGMPGMPVRTKTKIDSDNEFTSITKQLFHHILPISQLVKNPQFVRAIKEDVYNAVLNNKEVPLKDLKKKYISTELTESSEQEKEFEQLINGFYNAIKDISKKGIIMDSEVLKDAILEERNLKYSELYLGQNLFNNIKNYFRKRFKARVNTPENEAFNSKKYEEKNGINPLTLFNQVLKSFSCNGYLFNENFPYPPSQILQMKDDEFNRLHYNPSLTNASNSIHIGIDSLSSGEKTLLALASVIYKQIQKDQNDFISGVLLLDEIDTNLHPSMIRNMLKAINDIFIKKYMMKIIMVTHSPTTVALAPDDSLFVMNVKGTTGERIKKTTKTEALHTLTEGYATLESGIELIKLGKEKELVILTEGHNTAFIEKAIDFFCKRF